MDAILKAIVEEMEKSKRLSDQYYAVGNNKLGAKHLHLADGLERAHKIVISEMVGAK